jgi:hypothetical protein
LFGLFLGLGVLDGCFDDPPSRTDSGRTSRFGSVRSAHGATCHQGASTTHHRISHQPLGILIPRRTRGTRAAHPPQLFPQSDRWFHSFLRRNNFSHRPSYTYASNGLRPAPYYLRVPNGTLSTCSTQSNQTINTR